MISKSISLQDIKKQRESKERETEEGKYGGQMAFNLVYLTLFLCFLAHLY